MKICVQGLWHLGCVTAACLAEAGFEVVGLDADASIVAGLSQGQPPLFEPGLADLVAAGLKSGKLSFTTDSAAALADADIVWVAFDTPVDDDDRAEVDFVKAEIAKLFPDLANGAVVLVSSQVPVGSTRGMARQFAEVSMGRAVSFAYSPENLRLGAALDAFRTPERIVIGVRDDGARETLEPVLARFCNTLLWLSIESAEMTKHALNAFLATSITFTNEVASVCERVGADAREVEAALRAEPRIGRRAYVRAGPAFAGGTLARDVRFLTALGDEHGLTLPMLSGVIPSNAAHRGWALRRLREKLGDLSGRTVSVLGLAYKPGTDATRRSAAVELARALIAAGARVQLADPAVKALPEGLHAAQLSADVEVALAGADALVVATEWPEFASLTPCVIQTKMRRALVLDQARFLEKQLGGGEIEYLAVGQG
jgi:UDPglucose 6-dehydrogenase